VKFLILFKGPGSDRLYRELGNAGYPADRIKFFSNMPEAVKAARDNSCDNDIVLLSPGCASFGIFNNYKERGDLFKREFEKIKNKAKK
jgi:UDP-N-acetylmuramoylalanine--D-glutamate ligase